MRLSYNSHDWETTLRFAGTYDTIAWEAICFPGQVFVWKLLGEYVYVTMSHEKFNAILNDGYTHVNRSVE